MQKNFYFQRDNKEYLVEVTCYKYNNNIYTTCKICKVNFTIPIPIIKVKFHFLTRLAEYKYYKSDLLNVNYKLNILAEQCLDLYLKSNNAINQEFSKIEEINKLI